MMNAEEKTMKAKRIINELLLLNYNSDGSGFLTNELLSLIRGGVSKKILLDMLEHKNTMMAYMTASFIVEESTNNQCAYYHALTRKLLSFNNFRSKYPLLPIFSENATSDEDLLLLLGLLLDRNVIVCAQAMYCMSFLISNDIFKRSKELCSRNKLWGQDNKIHQLLCYCSLVRNNLPIEELSCLERTFQAEEVSEFFYFYIIGGERL